MNNLIFRRTLYLCLLISSFCQGQKLAKYNLSELLTDGKLITYPTEEVKVLSDNTRQGILCNGIVWLKGVTFSTGSIDIDIRGKDVFQQSFVGIAFHGVDTVTYDGIYFRPFNFQSPDTLRRKHMVQYISQPDYPWDRLRKEHPLMYESGITPAPLAAGWFHAHIVVDKESITVFVDHSKTPSLKVKKLNTRTDGLIGMWSSALSGDFANLDISAK
jgi:hypothetical protein